MYCMSAPTATSESRRHRKKCVQFAFCQSANRKLIWAREEYWTNQINCCTLGGSAGRVVVLNINVLGMRHY